MAKAQTFGAPLEIKFVGEDGVFSGYGSVFGNVDSYNEIVAKGAFTKTLTQYKSQGKMPAMLWMHDSTQPIGVWTEMNEDNTGLAVGGKLALDTQQGAEAYSLLKMGALKGMSIGYRVVGSQMDSASRIRTLTDVKLYEISLVTFPANEAATVTTVKAAESIKTIREFEEFLRDEGGFSHAAARDIACSGFKARQESRDENAGLNELAQALKQRLAILQPAKP